MASGLVELTPHLHAALINRLNHRSDPHTLPLPASTNGSHPANGEKRDTEGETGDSEAVLRHILDSRRCSSAEEVGGMVDEYVAGKPLAYITGQSS